MIDIKKVKAGDIFRLSVAKGYSRRQASIGMQVMEVYDDCVTLKCRTGCVTGPAAQFDYVTDVSELICVYKWNGGLEDHRTNQ